MANTDAEPIRLEDVGPYVRAQLPFDREVALPNPPTISASFLDVLQLRRSAETFAPIAAEDIGAWLHYTLAIRAVNSDDPNRQRRYVASFGALHPTHILLGDPNGTWRAYVPERHVLGALRVDVASAQALRARAQECFQTHDATLVALLADSDFAAHYYENPLSLMLRDGGVLLGHAALVAAALGLGFRILGGTGSPFAERLVPDLAFRPVATGLAWIGSDRAA
jgi:hypothetical protein